MPADSGPLRVIDAGMLPALRSQTVWHAIAHGVSVTGQPTLCFVRPASRYACLGYHRRLGELDLDYCAKAGIPVLRRMVGGGPVYLDDGQLFFQIVLPLAAVSPVRTAALQALLSPAVRAFRRCGVDARLVDGEICVADRKICGHGAGQVEEAVIVCGNLIDRFDYAAATRILRLPDPTTRAEVERLMRRYVLATPVPADRFQQELVAAYAEALGLVPEPGRLSLLEEQALSELDERFSDPGWLAGPVAPRDGPVQVKIKEGVRVAYARRGETSVLISSVSGRIVHAEIFLASGAGADALGPRLVDRELTELATMVEAAFPAGGAAVGLARELAA
ncbi:MAG: lipoate--protein ligase family protein [Mycobacteriales bacterium]